MTSFNTITGRDPVAGKDFDANGDICQDDYEFLTGTGRYADDTCRICGGTDDTGDGVCSSCDQPSIYDFVGW